MEMTGSKALFEALLAEGVDTIFGYPGGSIMPVYDTLYDYTDRITHYLTRHEQGAIHGAQGYARATGKPGVVVVTSGPGATNLVTGLSDACIDSTPLVCICGQVGANMLGYDAFQETDLVGVTLAVTKWAYQVRRAADLPWVLARAFYIATSGRPGPVVIDFTKNAQTELFDFNYQRCHYLRSYNPLPTAKPEALQRAAKLINEARQPMILAGQGVTISGARQQLVALAEKTGIPVAATMLGLSAMPTDHPLYKGMLGMHGNIAPNINTNRADLLLAVGMRFDDRVTGKLSEYAPNARIIHIDIDPSEIGKIITPEVGIVADAREALEQLLPLVDQRDHSAWCDTFDQINADEDQAVSHAAQYPVAKTGPMLMGEVIRKVSEAAGTDSIVVTDVGQNQLFAARYYRTTRQRGFISSGGLGTMGFGLPAAIGAKIGQPDATVCCIVGDGGIQMTIQEFGTIMQYGTAVKIIILNNSFLGNVRQWQELFFNRRYSQTPMINPDFAKIADAYGIKAEDVTDRSQLDNAIARMIAHPGAYILNVTIEQEDNVFPMITLGDPVDCIHINATTFYTPKI